MLGAASSGSRRWFQSCMVRPTTVSPRACSMPATTELSTPPDMATAMVRMSGIRGRVLAGARRLRCATHSANASTSASTCAASLERPSETRRLERACSRVRPMAVRTCDGSVAPLEQAEPLETAKPRRSRAISRGSVSMPSKRRFEVLGDTRSAPAVDVHVRNAVENTGLQPIPQGSYTRGFRLAMLRLPAQGRCQSQRSGDIVRACPAPVCAC